MRQPSRKLVYVLIMVAVFLVSYAAAFFVVSLTPYGHYKARMYSMPKDAPPEQINSSYWGGAWPNEYLYLGPGVGATNVPRDTAIIIEGVRPVGPFNFSFSPEVPVDKVTYKVNPGVGPSSTQVIYPVGLLQPNTTYNVSSIVVGTSSWWVFTTSSEPSQLKFSTQLEPYNFLIAFPAAILVTSIFRYTVYWEKTRKPSHTIKSKVN